MACSGDPLLLTKYNDEERERVIGLWRQHYPLVTWSWEVDRQISTLKGELRGCAEFYKIYFGGDGIRIDSHTRPLRPIEEAFRYERILLLRQLTDPSKAQYLLSARFFEAFPPVPVPEDDLTMWFFKYGAPIAATAEGLVWSFLWDRYLFDAEEGWKVNGESTREPGVHLQQQILRLETNTMIYISKTEHTQGS